LHPRLGRLLLAADATAQAANACALLSERHFLPPARASTDCDLWAASEDERQLPPHVRRVAREVLERARSARAAGMAAAPVAEGAAEGVERFRRAVLAAYPDRVAARRAPGSDRFLLASGTGARLGRESGVHAHAFVVAVDVVASRGRAGGGAAGSGEVRPPAGEAVIRMATGIQRAWLAPTSVDVEHVFDEAAGTVRAVEVERYGAIVLTERPSPVDPAVRAALLAEAYRRRGVPVADQQLLLRLQFARIDTEIDQLVSLASASASRLDDVAIAPYLSGPVRKALERDAPADLLLPSGRRARLTYSHDGGVTASVKLQELFGLGDTPLLGPRRVPVTFELLAPNGRPVQVTSDLRSFWRSTYAEVRKELRARYPKHPWPEDPWTAPPSARPKRRR
jgi:ATP-dependent helicase HrpB